jgi:hypothetical protein
MEEPTKYLPIFTGAIGVGKSRAAIIGMAYVMYLHLCLRDAFAYYGKAGGGKMAVVFFNLNMTLGSSKGFRILQNYLLSSEWFRSRGRVSGTVEKRIDFDLFEYVLASPYAQSELGQDVITALMDEVDSPKAGLQVKQKIVSSVQSALTRFEDRFVFNGQSLGKFFIVASKQENLSFINAFIAKKRGHKAVHIVDIPKWEADENEFKDCIKFPFLVGDMYSPSKIITSEEVSEALSNGFQVIWIPEQFRRAFEEDPIGALRDLAGISASYLRKNKFFKSEKYLTNCYDPTKENPVSVITIYLGKKESDKDLMYYLDTNKIRMPKFIPRCIHGDIAFKHDAYGLSMSGVSGWKEIPRQMDDGSTKNDKVPVIETDFVMRIKAPENDEIDLGKVRKFIIDLKKIKGYNIDLCTFDLRLLSISTSQELEKSGIRCEYFSIDKNPQLARNFRDDLVKEERWVCHKHPYLHFEFANLEEDPNTNKIDHPAEVTIMEPLDDGTIRELVIEGSKDLSDATIGSVMKALENCKTPPDIAIMKKAFAASTNSGEKFQDLWWLDSGSVKKSSEAEQAKPQNSDLTSKYKDIFKRAQGL